MPSILLTSLNARYIHASLGLRYLLSNMGDLKSRTRLLEFTINQRPLDIAEKILATGADIIGFGVYIWNIEQTTQVVRIIKQVSPQTRIILGGPEVSYETEQQEIVQLADYTITGQADHRFAELCFELLSQQAPSETIIHALPPALKQLSFPYREYTDEDVANRVIYVEASRGCPFKCEFCLSALDKTAVPFELEAFLQQMDSLYQRGVRHFKFVDRTFNLKAATTTRILDFFLQRLDEKLFLHFELIPDHLPDTLKSRIVQFPDNSLQFEIGIQTFNPEVQALISRKQDNDKTRDNIRWLKENTHAHLHTDLIIGLPGETVDSFAAGFDQLAALQPHEIQVGILKRLRGTPIIRHSETFAMRYNPLPPYNILSNRDIDFSTMQDLNRFARYWDMLGNSGRFQHTLPQLLGDQPFANFMGFSQWLYQSTDQTHRFSLDRLFVLLHSWLIQQTHTDQDSIEAALLADHQRSGLKGTPGFLQPSETSMSAQPKGQAALRQKRHS